MGQTGKHNYQSGCDCANCEKMRIPGLTLEEFDKFISELAVMPPDQIFISMAYALWLLNQEN